MSIKEIFKSMAKNQDQYWKMVLDQAIDADLSREDFDGGRSLLTIAQVERITR